jgi:ribonuclease P protein component
VAPQTLKKADKLLKRREFIELQNTGKKITNRHFVALASPGKTERTRLGITVSKKVGNAVVRNRIKRISREYFRKNRELFVGSLDINIIAKRSVADSTTDQVFAALQDLYNRIENSFEA